jgi:hypothetical protein
VRMNRSAYALAFGARHGVRRISMPSARNTSSKVGPKRLSRPDRSESCQHGEHESFFRPKSGSWHLAAHDVELMTKHQQLEVLGTRRSAPQQQDA